MDTQNFIEKAKKVHGDKYDYSKVEYIDSKTKVCIICPEHGEFYMKTGNHINGKQGCPKCGKIKSSNSRKKTTENFIKQSREIHGDKYDYSKVVYNGDSTKVCIICPEHGEFWQTPSSHLQKQGCSKCNGGIKHTQEDFIKKAYEVHGDKYDYSKVEYVNSDTKVCIICPEHGEFWQTPSCHNNLKNGCPKCQGKNKTTEDFIKQSREIHGDKYDYSKAVYKNAFGQVCIICPEHGEFWQIARNHLRGAGCKKCSHNKTQSITKECALKFTIKSREVHGSKYDYSKVVYKNAISKVCIICPEHGEFWQTPNKHLSGQGCPICKESSLEENIRVILENNNIKYQREKRFNGFNRRFDFYLPNDNIIIECQGIQHFKETNYFKSSLEESLQRDKEKYEWCKNNNFTILYFTNENFKKYIPYNKGVYTHNNTFFNTEKLIEARKLC